MNSTSREKCSFLDVIRLEDAASAVEITAVSTSVINAFTAVTAIFGNSLFLYVFAKVHSIRRPSNVLLASLSITDLIVGLIVQPTSIARRLLEANGKHDCPLRVTYAFFGFLCSGASFLNVGIIGLDRCLAICKPFWYESVATVQTHSILVLLVWLVWGLFTVFPFAGILSVGGYFIGVFVVLCSNLVIVFVSYLLIFRVIREKRNLSPSRTPRPYGIAELASASTTEATRNDAPRANQLYPLSNELSASRASLFQNRSPVTPAEKDRSRSKRNETRNTYTIAILIVCMVLCYAPQMIVLFMRGTFGDDENLVFVADAWVDTVTFINSSINPLLYCFRLTEIRAAVIRVFRRRTASVTPRPSVRCSSPAYIVRSERIADASSSRVF